MDLHAQLRGPPADTVPEHVTPPRTLGLGGGQDASFDQLLGHGVVGGDLFQARAAQQVATAVAGVNHVEPGPDDVGHRQSRPHAAALGVGLGGILDAFLAIDQGGLQLFLEVGFLVILKPEEPGQRVEYVARQSLDRNRAGLFARGMAAHPVRHQQKHALGAAVQPGMLLVLEAGLVNVHRLVKVGDQELVLVRLAHPADVRQAEAIHFATHNDTLFLP